MKYLKILNEAKEVVDVESYDFYLNWMKVHYKGEITDKALLEHLNLASSNYTYEIATEGAKDADKQSDNE